MDNTNNILEVSHLMKSFGSHEVLKDIDFTVKKGDVISIIGASGSGKSTMLRCINLLENPTGGSIFYHGEDITNPKIPFRHTGRKWVWFSRASTCLII